jgi:hypothetical protein
VSIRDQERRQREVECRMNERMRRADKEVRGTEDTGAGGDMKVHAERKVDQMGSEMFQD